MDIKWRKQTIVTLNTRSTGGETLAKEIGQAKAAKELGVPRNTLWLDIRYITSRLNPSQQKQKNEVYCIKTRQQLQREILRLFLQGFSLCPADRDITSILS